METIFVVERSEELRDKLDDYIKEKEIERIRVVFSDKKLGLSMARNLGIENAKGNIIGFVDDDVVLFPDWAEEMVKAFDSDSIIGVTGSAFPLWENDSLKWLPESMYWLISCTAWTGWKEKRKVRGAFGANMAFRAAAFNKGIGFSPEAGYTGGFRHQPISDDLEFSLRIRKKTNKDIFYTPYAQVWHRVTSQRLTVGFFVARSHQVGCTRRLIKKMYAEEFGNFEQENTVAKDTIKLLLQIPSELFKKPMIATKRFILVIIVSLSIGTGYLLPYR
jgi:GT2 family glycosyltransferase